MSNTERTPLKPLKEVGIAVDYVDQKTMDTLQSGVSLCDKIIAIVLYGHIVKKGDGWCNVSTFDTFLIIIHSTPWRLLMHAVMVISLIFLAYQVRSQDEMFVTKHVTDTFIANHFDSSHNTFLDIRRSASACSGAYARVHYLPPLRPHDVGHDRNHPAEQTCFLCLCAPSSTAQRPTFGSGATTCCGRGCSETTGLVRAISAGRSRARPSAALPRASRPRAHASRAGPMAPAASAPRTQPRSRRTSGR